MHRSLDKKIARADNDDFVPAGKSKILEEIARMSGLTEETIQAEILRRKRVLEWLKNNNVYDYNEVGKIVTEYYLNPEGIMSRIEGVGG